MPFFLKEPQTRDPRFADCREQLWLLKTLHSTAYHAAIPVVQDLAYARKREIMLRLRSVVVVDSSLRAEKGDHGTPARGGGGSRDAGARLWLPSRQVRRT